VIKTQALRTRADLSYTYVHILTLRTHFARPAQNERRFYGQNEHGIKMSIHKNLQVLHVVYILNLVLLVCMIYLLTGARWL
jgi:hypothetical protein